MSASQTEVVVHGTRPLRAVFLNERPFPVVGRAAGQSGRQTVLAPEPFSQAVEERGDVSQPVTDLSPRAQDRETLRLLELPHLSLFTGAVLWWGRRVGGQATTIVDKLWCWC